MIEVIEADNSELVSGIVERLGTESPKAILEDAIRKFSASPQATTDYAEFLMAAGQVCPFDWHGPDLGWNAVNEALHNAGIEGPYAGLNFR